LLRSDLPLALNPCATNKGPYDVGRNNTDWKLLDLEFLRDLSPGLRRYALFALNRTVRMDFLRALEHDPPAELLNEICKRPHNVWETAVWAEVAGRSLVRRGDGSHRLIPAAEIGHADTILPGGLRPCELTARDDGQFTFEPAPASSRARISERADPAGQERALRDALPALYRSFSHAPPN
jgi:pyrimidine-specific ribonucleoside hydrolase